MSEKESSPDLESLRLEIQRGHLSIEQLKLENERHRTFLQSWEADVRPIHEITLRAIDMVHAYAKMAMQTMFLLNGGALIAFPTFAQLAGVKFSANLKLGLLSILSFVIGLVLIAITSLLAYFTAYAESAVFGQHGEAAKLRLHLSRDPEEKNGKWHQLIAEAQNAIKCKLKSARCLRLWAIFTGIGSMVAFVAGSLVAALVLAGNKM